MQTWWVSKCRGKRRLTLVGPFPTAEAAARLIALARQETKNLGLIPSHYVWSILCENS